MGTIVSQFSQANKKNRELFEKIFSDVSFQDEGHLYFWKKKKNLISTTTLIGKLHEPFDPIHADNIGAELGFDPKEILKFWDDYGNMATLSGSIAHEVAEDFYNVIIEGGNPDYWELFNAKKYQLMYDDYKKRIEQTPVDLLTALNGRKVRKNQPPFNLLESRPHILAERFIKFYEATKDYLIPISMETIIGSSTLLGGLGLAGMIDCLFFDLRDCKLHIYDYKTNRFMKMMNKFQRMFYPFDKYEDCDFVHYSIQMSVYRLILIITLMYYGYNIPFGDTYLVHLTEEKETFDLIKVDFYKNETLKLLYPNEIHNA